MIGNKKISRRKAIVTVGAALAGAASAYFLLPFRKGKSNLFNSKNAMKVLLINGSGRESGCTFTALSEVAASLEKNGVAAEIFWLGNEAIAGCIGCGACRGSGECFRGDVVNDVAARLDDFDGLVFGSPVHYAAASGYITPFLDRLFYSSSKRLAGKPGAAVVSCRRAGSTAALEQLQKYVTICNMPLATSQYWCMVHGNTPDEVRQDLEGMQTMRTLGQNMAWLLKSIAAGRKAGIAPPDYEARVGTNFIR